jgi:hypothetical protein
MSIYQVGRFGRIYGAQEASYGTSATLVAGDAVRHLNVKFGQNPRNRVNSPERNAHPSLINRFTRRKTAEYSLSGILYPSGTINTVPDLDFALEAVFGAKTNVTLATTVSAAPAPTATTFTVVSVTGLAIGQPILVNATTGGRQVRWITAINTLELVVAPALAAAPITGDSVKGCIGYKLTTALLATGSLNFARYLGSMSFEMNGCAPESLKLTFDANNEIMWELSGPAQKRTRPAQADPATFTTVGSQPPSGLTGYLRINATAEEFLTAAFEIKNNITLDNVAFGTSQAQAMFRAKKREVTVNLTTMVSDDITILDAAENTTDTVALIQCGLTEGNIVAMYCPRLELDTPDDTDAEETTQFAYKGTAKGTVGNDECYLAIA